MFKTVSTDCNLDCQYCYYRESLEGTRVRRRISYDMIAHFIPRYLEYVGDNSLANFIWQGGEPTLAGLEFFQSVIELQQEHTRPGTIVSNALQTNGVLIDGRWARFLADNQFLVGISIDGPQEIHDSLRKDRGGHGSFTRVMAGLGALRAAGVEVSVLCVLGPHNIKRTHDLMRFFRQTGVPNVQFIPAMDFQGTGPYSPANYRITSAEYGQFLIELFDEWYGDGAPQLSIRIFNNFLQSSLSLPNDACVHSESCNGGLIVEYDGDVYPCDFYITPEYRLGNVVEDSIGQILGKRLYTEFTGQKQPLPQECTQCEYLRLCNSGCPRNRLAKEGGRDGPDYFCASYKQFFAYAAERLDTLGERIARRWQFDERVSLMSPREQRFPGRNDPCLCGSSRKYKACCGSPALTNSYLFSPVK